MSSGTKNYQDYKVIDFMMDKSFFQWVFQPDESSDRFWKVWLKQHPEKYGKEEEARWMILRLREILGNDTSAFSRQEVNDVITRIRITLKYHRPDHSKWLKKSLNRRSRLQ